MDILAASAMNLFFIATIVTSGLVSVETPMPSFVTWIHKIGPWATVVSAELMLFSLHQDV